MEHVSVSLKVIGVYRFGQINNMLRDLKTLMNY